MVLQKQTQEDENFESVKSQPYKDMRVIITPSCIDRHIC